MSVLLDCRAQRVIQGWTARKGLQESWGLWVLKDNREIQVIRVLKDFRGLTE